MPPRLNADYSRTPTASAPRFFCENCNHEVPFNAEMCPNCRKTFDAVKCPNCGYSDRPAKFAGGCPHCGHLATRTRIGRKTDGRLAPPSSRRKKKKGSELFFPLMGLLLIGMLGLIVYYFVTPQ